MPAFSCLFFKPDGFSQLKVPSVTEVWILERVASNRIHLMESKQFINKAQIAARYVVSGKICNAVDRLLWPTEGHIFWYSGHRCALIVVNQTTSQDAPCQRTRKYGQLNPIECDVL